MKAKFSLATLTPYFVSDFPTGMFSLISRTSSVSCHCFLIKPMLSSRQMAIADKIAKLHPHKRLVDLEKHRLIYEFKHIRIPAGFLKLKYTFPFLALAGIPFTFALDSSGTTALLLTVASASQIGIIIAFSKFFNNLIGRVYVSKEEGLKEVVISAVDKSGKRLDRIHNPNDLLVHYFSSRLEEALGVAKIMVKDSDIVYRLFVKSCTFHDKKACVNIFGSIFV